MLQTKRSNTQTQLAQVEQLRNRYRPHKRSFYVTFGTDKDFPLKENEFVQILAYSENQARELFRIYYPDRNPNVLNFSFIYSETEWQGGISDFYKKTNECGKIVATPTVILDIEYGKMIPCLILDI